MDYNYVTVRDFTPNWEQWTPVGDIQSIARTGDVFTLVLEGGGRTVQISFLSDSCFRVRFNPAVGATYTTDASPAVITRNLGAVALNIVEQSPARLVVDTGRMRLDIGLRPYRVRVYRGQQLISADEPVYNLVYIPNKRVIANVKTRAPGACYCGFGEKAGAQLLKNEFTMTQFNYDNYVYQKPTAPPDNNPLNPSIALYTSIPFMLEVNPRPGGDFSGDAYACGIFFDNIAQSYFNMGSSDYSNMDGKYYFGALYRDLDYYFFLGADAPDVLAQYTTLTGRGPMPPRYVLGFHQGCYGYFDKATLQRAAQAYRAARIPCDGLHIDVDFQDNYRTFTHSARKFPNVRQMMDDLHNIGFKCSTNITPILTDVAWDENSNTSLYAQREALGQIGGLIYATYASQAPSDAPFRGKVNYGANDGFNPYAPVGPLSATGNYPDMGRADVRRVWGDQYAHLINDVDLDMVWQDMMCPALDFADVPQGTFPLDLMVNDGAEYVPNAVAHNAYGLYTLMGTWEGLLRLRPGKRNFIIARGGYAGMQRYAALWTGDSASSWDFLRINMPEVLNLGLSGIPISGCDIGGFGGGSGSEGGGVTNYELLTRWMQLGSFLPWYRNHYNGYTKAFQEPWRYGEPVPTNCRKYVELRYRMLQVYYDAMYEWTESGMPIARALFLNDPADPEVYKHLDHEFFVGRDFLVAPIVEPGQGNPPVAIRSLYVPAGSDWYAFMDREAKLDPPVPGGSMISNWRAGLHQVPIYVREGAILPMRGLEQYVGELAQNPLEIDVYPGRASEYRLYQDDGVSTKAHTNGEFRVTRISHSTNGAERRVRVQRVTDNYTPPEPYFLLRILNTAAPSRVDIAGQGTFDAGSEPALRASKGDGYYFDARLATTVVKVLDIRADVTVLIA